jgi:hypothetical protein
MTDKYTNELSGFMFNLTAVSAPPEVLATGYFVCIIELLRPLVRAAGIN